MGLFDELLGNIMQNNNGTAEKELRDILIPNEKIGMVFTLIRDLVVSIGKRLILVNRQGITGRKVDYRSAPYKSISRFSVKTSGHFGLSAGLKIWISSTKLPSVDLQFRKDKDIVAIQQVLAVAVLSRVHKKRQESDQLSCFFNFR